MSDLQAVVREFGASIGLPQLALDQHQATSLLVDDRWPVDVELAADGSRLRLSLAVGPLPLEERERIAVELLEANRRSLAEGAVAFALHPVNEEIVVATSLPAAGLNAAGLHSAVTALIHLAEHWTAAHPLDLHV